MASLPPQDEYRALVKRLQSSNYFLNKQLQHICQVNSLSNRGVKAELQKRIIEGMSNWEIKRKARGKQEEIKRFGPLVSRIVWERQDPQLG